MSTTAGVARLALKVGGIASVLGGLAFIYFSFGIGGETPKKEASASATSSAAPSQKPIHAMNLALGDMVFLAQDLGYSVKTSKDTTFESNKVALRIESHLQKLREIYRQESGKNPTLVGSILLQFNIAASGEVSEVKELSSRLNDSEFKKAMIAEVAKWSFSEIVSENVTVTCPLLFVREGMDITTLVLWEKSLGNVSEKPVLAATASKPVQVVATKKPPATTVKTDVIELEIKYPTALRKDPNFSSASLTTFTEGTRIMVLRQTGDWLEVRAKGDSLTGFIRKEFAKSIEVAGY